MNRYVIAIPRAAIGLAAVAMTALTFAVTIVLPATLAAGNLDESSPVAAAARGPQATPAVLRVDVVGTREQATAMATGQTVAAKSGQCT